jgi:hypothetical protein
MKTTFEAATLVIHAENMQASIEFPPITTLVEALSHARDLFASRAAYK